MKPTTTIAQIILLFFACCLGCNSADSETEKKGKAKSSESNLPPKEQYVADFGVLVDSVVKALEPVEDDASAEKALEELAGLQSVAEGLGKQMDQLRLAVEDDAEASDQLIRYVQDELQAKYTDQISGVRTKLGTKNSTSYPKLLEASGNLFNTAMRD